MPAPVKALDSIGTADPGRRAMLSRALALLLLRAVGSAGFGAAPAVALALAKPQHGRLLTITYPAGASIRFDASYYRDHHTKLFMDIYGSAIERFELRTLRASLTGDTPHDHEAQPQAAAFSAVINIWIADFELFHARSTEAAYQRMGADKKNFTNTSSSIQVDEVQCAAGDPRSRISKGSDCLSLLYPASAAGSWNDDEHCRAYVEGMMRLLGPSAVQRIEVRQGIQQLDDGNPTYQGGINIYVRNPLGFSRAWQQHKTAVESLSRRLCSAEPLELSTTVFGIDTTHGNT